MWTREDAILAYRALLCPAAQQHGFSAALYGSTLLNDEGNDLDIFIVPQRQNADVAGFLGTLRRHMRTVTEPVAGDWNRDFVVATTQDGKLIDIQFTRV